MSAISSGGEIGSTRPGRAGRRRRRSCVPGRWPAAASACPRAGRRRPACRCGLVAERAEDVVAQLERLAERRPVGRQRTRRARRGDRRARRRRGAAARSCTCRTCSGRCGGRWRGRCRPGRCPARRGTGPRSARSSARSRPRTPRPVRPSSADRRTPRPDRRSGSPPLRRSAVTRPATSPARGSRRTRRGRCARPAGWPIRPSRRRGRARRRGAARRRRPCRSTAGRRARHRPRRRPSGRTPGRRRLPPARTKRASASSGGPRSGSTAAQRPALAVEHLAQAGLDRSRDGRQGGRGRASSPAQASVAKSPPSAPPPSGSFSPRCRRRWPPPRGPPLRDRRRSA